MTARFAGRTLFVAKPNKYTEAAKTFRTSRPDYAKQLDQLGEQPKADWVTSTSAIGIIDPRLDAAAAAGQIAAFVLYAIPNRDLGSHSAGGEADAAAYRSFIDKVAAAIAGRECIVILEPDALSMIDRMSSEGETARYDLLKYAVSKIPDAYADSGSSNWVPAATVAARIQRIGAKRFSLNTSMTQYAKDEHAYAQDIRSILGASSSYVIDTGRNGLGPYDPEMYEPGHLLYTSPLHPDYSDIHWLNSPGRGIGARPTLDVYQGRYPGCDGYLFVKGPGGSDGADKRGHLEAGGFDPYEALSLRTRARPKFPDPV